MHEKSYIEKHIEVYDSALYWVITFLRLKNITVVEEHCFISKRAAYRNLLSY